MKTEIISEELIAKSEDWNKVRLMRYYYPTCEPYIVLTSGKHTDDKFSGIVISGSEESFYKVGEMSDSWHKKSFTEVAESITIKFTPEA